MATAAVDVNLMDFDDAAPVEVPVRINKEDYILREASGAAAVKWRNVTIRSARMIDGKVVGVGDVADAEPLLVSLCLFKLVGEGKEKPVTKEQVLAWPQRIQKALFDKVKAISGLDEAETEESITREITFLQEKLTELRDKKASSNGDELGDAGDPKDY